MLLKKYKTPDNVVLHIEAVTKVGVTIAKALEEKGLDVDVEVVERACLLHDMVRQVSFSDFSKVDPDLVAIYEEQKKKYGELGHKKAAEVILKEEGYPELGHVVRLHGFVEFGTDEGPKTWEEKILNYADKRVRHETIVGLIDRIDDIVERHKDRFPDSGDLAEEKKKLFIELEKELFNKLDLKPSDLND